MNQVCKNCGAEMAEGERFCTSCGKVAPKQRKATVKNESQFSAINQGMYENKQITDVKRQFSPTMTSSSQVLTKERQRSATEAAHKVELSAKAAEKRRWANNDFDAQAQRIRPSEVETTSGNEKKSSLHPILNKIAWTIFGLVVLYFVIGGIILMIYRNDTYKNFRLESEEKIVASTYAEAMHNYFESGWWHCRITSGVTYVGKTSSGDKYELHFTRRNGKRIVDEVKKNGEKIDSDDIMNGIIKEMFLADERP